MSKQLGKSFDRVAQLTLAILNGKWTTEILWHLNRQPHRYSELRAAIPGLSDKMLTQRLRDLTESGLITHRRAPRSTAAQYALTPKGRLVDALLQDISAWGHQYSRHFNPRIRGTSGLADARKKAR